MKGISKKNRAMILPDAVKISLGCAAAIVLAMALGLKYSVTAGLITVLSIQTTKKETAVLALKRLAAFLAAILISFLCFTFLGYNTLSFALYLFFFIIVCRVFDLQGAIVPVSVLVGHILGEERFTADILLNEFLLLLIGAGVGVLMNIYLRKNVNKMAKNKEQLDGEIKRILSHMAQVVLVEDKSDYDDKCFIHLNELLSQARETAAQNMSNSLFHADDRDMLYLEMREKQCLVLKEMYKDVKAMDSTLEQSFVISEFLRKISEEYHEKNDVAALSEEADGIISRMKSEPMPETRREFENRAILYSLLMKIKDFLYIKRAFMENG